MSFQVRVNVLTALCGLVKIRKLDEDDLHLESRSKLKDHVH
jgi:hypothetical protein